MFISVLIPVYKQPKLLEDIIEKILKNKYEEKEILVAIDGETNPEIEKVVSKYRGRVVIHYNGIHQGKVNLLNHLSEFARGEVLLFLDNVELPDNESFLSKLSKEIIKYDIVELPKEAIVSNFFSKIISYDFLTVAVLCFIISKTFKTNLFLSGAAFAIKKQTFEELGKFSKVINEDWDLMLKAFSLKKRYSFPTNLKVKTLAPANLDEWIKQRNRWVLGIKFWWKQVTKNIKHYIKGLPRIFNIILFSSIPLIIGLIIKEFNLFSKFIPTLIILTQHLSINSAMTSIIYFLSLTIILLQGLGPFLVSLFISSITFFVFSKVLKFRFNIGEYLIYSLFYLPVMALFYCVRFMLSEVILKPQIEWKID
ncbi:MAG: Glycosyl transferase, family 2 [candidate division TA06 bacterium 32_111]|nr:MAG: Glycosyl transferase, family 2 [candidate division TA06 bacterium 32_111]KUK88059.1 MAG: Glycosyl transferase, family 2 [candidate division TA06 bacterium 34_109]